MPVARIERIIGGVVRGRVERGSGGFFAGSQTGAKKVRPEPHSYF